MSEEKLDLYAVLGISRSASGRQVKDAFRKRAAKTHPDRNAGDRAEFEKVKLAWEVLGDPKRRRAYNETGEYTSTKPDNSMGPILEVINQAFSAVGQGMLQAGKKASKSDVLAAMRECIEQNTERMRTAKTELVKPREFLKEALDRFETDDPDNLLRAVVVGQLAQLELHEKNCEATIAKNDAALAFLKKYRYRFVQEVQTFVRGAATLHVNGIYLGTTASVTGG